MDPTPHHPAPERSDDHVRAAHAYLEAYLVELDRAGPEHRPEHRVIAAVASVLDQLHRIVETRDPAYRIEKVEVLIRAGLELQLEVYEQLAPTSTTGRCSRRRPGRSRTCCGTCVT